MKLFVYQADPLQLFADSQDDSLHDEEDLVEVPDEIADRVRAAELERAAAFGELREWLIENVPQHPQAFAWLHAIR